jgi:hypothetical protein
MRRYIPEDRTRHNHRRENLKSYIMMEKIVVNEGAKATLKLSVTYMKHQSFRVSWVVGYFLTVYQMQSLISTMPL